MFCYVIVKVADSADSATIEVDMAIASMVMSVRPMFYRVSENMAAHVDLFGDSAVSDGGVVSSNRLIFTAQSCGVADSADSARMKWFCFCAARCFSI